MGGFSDPGEADHPWTFDGRFENERGVGTMTFVPNREFARAMEQQTNDTFTDRELFSYAVLDVSRAFVSELQALGFRDVTLADARKLRIHGTTIDFNDSLMSRGFTFKNPTASGTCGCGDSFSI